MHIYKYIHSRIAILKQLTRAVAEEQQMDISVPVNVHLFVIIQVQNTFNGQRAEHSQLHCLFATAAILANSERNQLQSILLPIRTAASASVRYSYCMPFESSFQIILVTLATVSFIHFSKMHTLQCLHPAVLPTVQTRYWIGDVPTEALTPWSSKLLTSWEHIVF